MSTDKDIIEIEATKNNKKEQKQENKKEEKPVVTNEIATKKDNTFKNTSGRTIILNGVKIAPNIHIEGTDEDFAELIKKRLITKINSEKIKVQSVKKEEKNKLEY